MNSYINFVSKYAKSIILLLVLITGFFTYQISYLTEDSNPYLLPESHPARSSLLEMREEFTGTYDSILIALYNHDTIFNQESLNAIFSLTQSARKIMLADQSDIDRLALLKKQYPQHAELAALVAGVLAGELGQDDAAPVRQFVADGHGQSLSAADAKYLRVLAERLDPVREMAGMAATENVFLEPDGTLRASITLNHNDSNSADIQKAIMKNELMEMGVVDKLGHVGLVVIEVSVLQDDAEGQLRAYDAIRLLVDEYQAANPQLKDEVYIGGVPVFFAEQKKIMDRDLGTLLPAVMVLIALILIAFFRSGLGVAIPLVNVVMCTIWTMGAMAMVGIPVDLITSVLPVFLITICSSDAIHVMAEYYHQRRQEQSNKQAVVVTIRLMTAPVVLTTITTCLTFIISTTTSISNLQNFGLSMSFGMFVAMVISLLLIPAWLSLLKPKNQAKKQDNKPGDSYLISRCLISIFKPVIAYRARFMVLTSVVLAGLVAMALQVSVDDMGSGYFAPDNEFRIADDFINGNVAGTSPGWIEIDAGEPGAALDYDTIMFVDKLEKFIHQQANITFSYSAARYVRRMNLVLNDMAPEYDRLPYREETFTDTDEETGLVEEVAISGQDIIRQSILMYENGGGSDLTNVLNEDFSKTVMLYTMNTTVASEFQAFLDVLIPWLEDNTPAGISYKLAGAPIIWTAVLDELISGQVLSIGLAFLTVVLTMSLWLKSWKMGLVGTLPLAATVVIYYATMAFFGIELNIGTAIISFLILGIVDYSVHYLLRTKHGVEQGLSIDDALLQALSQSGRSIIANVFVFSIGFIALLFSEFKPIVDLGTLVGLSLFISGIMSIYVITLLAPWLIPSDNVVTVKDPLTV
ncbi:transporter [Photobacterium gaetbulicola]|uniref:Putative RND efflux transporter n=1 Tax=Photobacterium gaetbulicola Gung47 TaxID=658445 RepID=A0A0C5WU14_9GAMM|nr:MMPL family transporter [Photobacterium gaetbulicola]AJR06545.1 putative RND efflux transporter [Photobacterium gaetbulicola Gung47]PSU03537.1 transporter [Photobacterium gaetbulicola]